MTPPHDTRSDPTQTRHVTFGYSVPVYVEVDMEEEVVTAVSVDDGAEIEEPWLVDADPNQQGKLLAKAVDVANDALWPQWEFGF